MAQIDLIIGDNVANISASSLADANLAQFPAASLTLVSDTLTELSGNPISSLTTDTLKAELKASQDLKWNFTFDVGASLGVTYSASFDASVEIRKKGEIFPVDADLTFDDDLPLQPPASPSVDPSAAYVSIRLRVAHSASGQLGFTHGLFGIKANAGAGQTFLLAYHHRVSANTNIGDAIQQAFVNFVLPFSSAGAANIQPGCFSEWEYIGKVDAGFQATVGFSHAVLGDRALSELKQSFNSNVAKAGFSMNPTVQVGAAFALSYTHEDAFRTVLGSKDAGSCQFFLYKMNRNDLNVTLGFNASAKVNATVQLSTQVTAVTTQMLESLIPANVPGREDLTQKLLATLPAGDVDRATEEVQKKINDFLSNLDKLTVSASIASERLSEHQSLLTFTLPRDANGRLAGLEEAIDGRLRDALAVPGVTLAPGSFVRDTVTRRTTMRLQLFGAFEANSIDEYVRFGEMVYDGDGVFRLRFTRGRKASSNFFGHRKQVEVLFTATAKAFANQQIKDADVRLKFTLTNIKKLDESRRTASALQLIIGNSDMDLARRMRDAIEQNHSITTRLTCSFAPSAFRRLVFTALETPRKAKTLPHASDASNYAAFVSAFNSLSSQPFPKEAAQFIDWAQFNMAVNDSPNVPLTASSRPNRRSPGNQALSNWPQFGNLSNITDDTSRLFAEIPMEAARCFMNSCEDLVTLAADLDQTSTDAAFGDLIQDMDGLAKGELSTAFPLDFAKVTLVALVFQMSPSKILVQGPSGTPTDDFEVRLDVA